LDIKHAICHEAGHTVSALHFGFVVGRIELFHGMPRSMIALDCKPETLLKCCIVLASGVAAEQMAFQGSDVQAAASDRTQISNYGGGMIDGYLDRARDVLGLYPSCMLQFREQLTRKWIEEQTEREAELNFEADSDSLSFELLSRGEIEAIWRLHGQK
jgi:hypothetical protein